MGEAEQVILDERPPFDFFEAPRKVQQKVQQSLGKSSSGSCGQVQESLLKFGKIHERSSQNNFENTHTT